MVGYWILFAIPALSAIAPFKATLRLQRVLWVVVGIFFTLFIGLRYQVGGDWGTYVSTYDNAVNVSLGNTLTGVDPLYGVLNWFSAKIGGGVYFVNLVCAAIVITGLFRFCQRQPLPWLALLIAVPYMLIVAAMGYTRQGTAMGFELLALVALMDGRLRLFLFYIVCGALFHRSAFILIPLAFLVNQHNKFTTVLGVGTTILVIGAVVIVGAFESLWRNYVQLQMVSEGGPIRVAMNFLPALLFLLFRRRLTENDRELRIWTWIAVLSILCVPLVSFASTAVDRVALYFMPIQLFVLTRIHWLFNDRVLKTSLVVGVVIGYGLVEWVWLNFASHAVAWRPYQFFPLTLL